MDKIVNSVRADDWTAEWTIIASNVLEIIGNASWKLQN